MLHRYAPARTIAVPLVGSKFRTVMLVKRMLCVRCLALFGARFVGSLTKLITVVTGGIRKDHESGDVGRAWIQ
jgi:hypothetical protein